MSEAKFLRTMRLQTMVISAMGLAKLVITYVYTAVQRPVNFVCYEEKRRCVLVCEMRI